MRGDADDADAGQDAAGHELRLSQPKLRLRWHRCWSNRAQRKRGLRLESDDAAWPLADHGRGRQAVDLLAVRHYRKRTTNQDHSWTSVDDEVLRFDELVDLHRPRQNRIHQIPELVPRRALGLDVAFRVAGAD